MYKGFYNNMIKDLMLIMIYVISILSYCVHLACVHYTDNKKNCPEPSPYDILAGIPFMSYAASKVVSSLNIVPSNLLFLAQLGKISYFFLMTSGVVLLLTLVFNTLRTIVKALFWTAIVVFLGGMLIILPHKLGFSKDL